MNVWTERQWECLHKTGDAVPFDLRALLLDELDLHDEEAIHDFLYPDFDGLLDPHLFEDMALALEIIDGVVKRQGRILVYGDYDCDGLTSTALLLRFFRHLGISCEAMIPNRLEDGYGLGENALEQIMQNPPDLVITVDCGSSSAKEISGLMEQGIPVILTDHHQVPEERPYPMAFINPCRAGEPYPFKGLAGVGVTFKLVQALAARYCPDDNPLPWVCLAALGTVADYMPLNGENRILVHLGLRYFAEMAPLGLRILSEKFERKSMMDSGFFSFGLAPRLNAAGRMGNTDPALRLLLTDSADEAIAAAEELEAMNEKRRELESAIYEAAVEQIRSMPKERRRDILVVGHEEWHPGVVGIVSARLVEKYRLPVICFGGVDGELRGSGRSCGNFDMLSAIRSAADECLAQGGHTQACGVTLLPDRLESFKDKLCAYAAEHRSEYKADVEMSAFCVLPHEQITEDIPLLLEQFEPFGAGNEKPLFIMENLRIVSLRRVGNGSHLSLIFKLQDGREVRSIAFRMGDFCDIFAPGDEVDVLGELTAYEWNGRRDLQIRMSDMKRSRRELQTVRTQEAFNTLWADPARAAEAASAPEAGEALLPISEIAPFWVWLSRLLGEEEKSAEIYLLCHAYRAVREGGISYFACARILDILSEAGLLNLKYQSPGRVRLSLGRPEPGVKPVLSEQPTWQRLEREGGIRHA